MPLVSGRDAIHYKERLRQAVLFVQECGRGSSVLRFIWQNEKTLPTHPHRVPQRSNPNQP